MSFVFGSIIKTIGKMLFKLIRSLLKLIGLINKATFLHKHDFNYSLNILFITKELILIVFQK